MVEQAVVRSHSAADCERIESHLGGGLPRSILPAERRDLARRKALLRRIQGEFLDLRGMSLTLAQAARLFGVPPDACARILRRFAEQGLLRLTVEGRYVLRGTSEPRPLASSR